jgi:predicted peroxiredoxin
MQQGSGRVGRGAIALLGAVLVLPLATQLPGYAQPGEITPNTGEEITAANQQKIIVHLKHSTDDLHAVFMALKLGGNMQRKGAQVTVVLTLEGVRLADARQPLDLRWGNSTMTIAELYEDFVTAGGKIIICPVCASAVGIDQNSLRPGSQLALEDNEIPNLILAADKVLDF